MVKRTTEIRWHGRGGQGAKTAAQLVAQVALGEGKHSQGFPEYGPERMGAPVRGFTRISDGPIRLHCPIERPDVVVVLDETLVGMPAVTEAAGPQTVFVINTAAWAGQDEREAGHRRRQPDLLRRCHEDLDRRIGPPHAQHADGRRADQGDRSASRSTPSRGTSRGSSSRSSASGVVQGNIRAIERAYEEVQSP